jgi:hypothetical protein
VFEGVVVAAEEFEVPEGGGSPIGPMADVVSVAPLVGTVTAGIPAVTITGDQSPPHRRGHHPRGPADIDRFRSSSKHDPVDHGVTCGLPHLVRREDLPVRRLMDSASESSEGVKVGQNQDMRLLGPRSLTRVEEGAGQIGKSVGPPLPGRPMVTFPAGRGDSLQSGQHQIPRHRI